MNRTHRLLCSLVPTVALTLLLGSPPAHAQEAKQEAKPTKPNIDEQAMAAVKRFSDFLTSQKQFSLTVDVGFDIVQDWGQKIEFGETRKMTVSRPDRIRVDTTDRDGAVSLLMFNGKEIAYFDSADNAYATVAKPGTIIDAASYFANDLGMRLPMGAMLSGRLPQLLSKWALNGRYVDKSSINGVACDHLALHGDREDIQMWIAQGDKPLLQRMVITYDRTEGKPQFWAQVREWNLSAEVTDALFTFTPPAGAVKVAFAPKGYSGGQTVQTKGGQQ